ARHATSDGHVTAHPSFQLAKLAGSELRRKDFGRDAVVAAEEGNRNALGFRLVYEGVLPLGAGPARRHRLAREQENDYVRGARVPRLADEFLAGTHFAFLEEHADVGSAFEELRERSRQCAAGGRVAGGEGF